AMSTPKLALNLTEGITQMSSRISLKMMFAQFGEVTSCWVPPLENRGKETAWVKFDKPGAAQAALDACVAGQIYLDGVKVSAEWRLVPAKTVDSRDFDAKGSNLFSSRDLMLAEQRKNAKNGGRDGRDSRDNRRGDDRRRGRSGSRDRKARSRSRSKGKKDKKKGSKRKSSSSSSSSSSAKKKDKKKDSKKEAKDEAPAPTVVRVVRLPPAAPKAPGATIEIIDD
ncbi:unnamed protein product, partial [Polarella glacialis]